MPSTTPHSRVEVASLASLVMVATPDGLGWLFTAAVCIFACEPFHRGKENLKDIWVTEFVGVFLREILTCSGWWDSAATSSACFQSGGFSTLLGSSSPTDLPAHTAIRASRLPSCASESSV